MRREKPKTSETELVFPVVYADPAWAYRNVKTGGSHRSGSAQHYPTLTPAQVAALPVLSIVPKSATLWLWATAPLLPEILPVLPAWGFTYTATIVWRKVGRRGMGYWFRNEAEFLLLGVRGKVPAFRSSQPNVIEAAVEDHSRKPAVFRHLIEQFTPGQRRVELFAREKAIPGWTCWGLESDGCDLRELETYRRLGTEEGQGTSGRNGARSLIVGRQTCSEQVRRI